MQGLAIGRSVHYVLKNGDVRPLIVVSLWNDDGTLNGVLHFDGSNDAEHLPFVLQSGQCTAWITSAHYDETKKPGTWHWPARA